MDTRDEVAVGSAPSIRRGEETLWRRPATKGKLAVGPPRIHPGDGATFIDVDWKVTSSTQLNETWVRVSIDEGKTWRAAATGLRGHKASISAANLPAGPMLVQVVLHDGFRSATSKAVPFENVTLPPVASILHPQDRQELVASETLMLWGSMAGQPARPLVLHVPRRTFTRAWALEALFTSPSSQSEAPKPVGPITFRTL